MEKVYWRYIMFVGRKWRMFRTFHWQANSHHKICLDLSLKSAQWSDITDMLGKAEVFWTRCSLQIWYLGSPYSNLVFRPQKHELKAFLWQKFWNSTDIMNMIETGFTYLVNSELFPAFNERSILWSPTCRLKGPSLMSCYLVQMNRSALLSSFSGNLPSISISISHVCTPHSTQSLILCAIVICSETEVQLRVVRDTVNMREVMLDNLKQQGSQTRTLRYATVKWELSRRRPIDGDLLAPIRQIWAEPVKHFPMSANIPAQSLQQGIMIKCVKYCASIQQDHQGHMLQVHFQEDVVHNFEQGRFSAVILTIGRLQIRIDFIDDHVLVPFHWNRAFSTSLEMNCRLLTGLTLWKTKSSPSFFSKGWTSAHIHWLARSTPLVFLNVTVFLVEYIAGKSFLFISLKEKLDLSLFI